MLIFRHTWLILLAVKERGKAENGEEDGKEKAEAERNRRA